MNNARYSENTDFYSDRVDELNKIISTLPGKPDKVYSGLKLVGPFDTSKFEKQNI